MLVLKRESKGERKKKKNKKKKKIPTIALRKGKPESTGQAESCHSVNCTPRPQRRVGPRAPRQ